MLISTSRKPSQKTRKFCKNLAHATGSTNVNRGKSNMRELLLKALELDEHNLAIVNEIKGNPSRVTFYSNKGEILLIILIGVTTSNERCHILPKNLKIVSKVEKLNVLSEILGFELVDKASENYILISKEDDLIAKINFVNKFGDKKDFRWGIMNVDSPLESIKSDIAIEFENQKQAKIIYESIILEFETAPDYRSSMSLTLDESRILIRIDAEDSTSFRASVNSAIKWIKLSLEINNLTI